MSMLETECVSSCCIDNIKPINLLIKLYFHASLRMVEILLKSSIWHTPG